ncbi:MAG: hypothetical protein IIC41_06980 [Candidatus Marinimicrobia bacterium]|nr:hypothetical protein [Candidatus Neomarinimicrobiota bacterium]
MLLTILIGLQADCDQQAGDEITIAELTAARVPEPPAQSTEVEASASGTAASTSASEKEG